MTQQEIATELTKRKSLAAKLELMGQAYDLEKPLPALTALMIDRQLLNIANVLKLQKK